MSAAAVRPRFFGAVRGEAIKVTRQLSFWLMLVGAFVLLGVIILAISSAQNVGDAMRTDPTGFLYTSLDIFGTTFQIGSGIFLLIIGSRLIGMEYSSGTVRILYARGAGRLRLLLAKMLALALIGVALLAGYALVVGGIMAALIAGYTGSLDPLQQVSNAFWQDLARWGLVQGMSMSMAILLAAAAAGLGRSLAFAMAGSLAFFPADNFLTIILALGARATGHIHPWYDISQYQLGGNLNVVLRLIEPSHHSRPAFAAPLLPVDATHALSVIGVYAVLFAALAIWRAIKPDVLE